MLKIASLPKHHDEISLMLRDKKLIFLIALNNELVGVDGHDLLCADRTRNGGVVCIYVRCNINYQKSPDL